MSPRIHYTRPSITELETRYATDAATNGWGERCYDYIARFESAFREKLGAEFSVATSSCTGALHMGLAALGVGPGDEVILADTNWIATAAPIVHLGATPVFVDIDPTSWCISAAAAKGAISDRTKAIVAVHLYGNLCPMPELLALGDEYGIPIIEDAAEAIGSKYGSHHAGTMGRFGAFSFHGTKTMTTGEGGMFVTNDRTLYERVSMLAAHGRSPHQKRQFWADAVGYKYKMSNVQAAIGLAQTERLEELVARKRSILNEYRGHLADLGEVSLNSEPDGVTIGAWMPNATFAPSSGVTREALQLAFGAANIDARVFFYPLSGLPMFEPCRANVHAWDIPERSINLPSYHDMSQDDIERVCKVLRGVIK